MNDRFLMSLGAIALAILVTVVLVAPTSAAAQAQKAAAATVTKAAAPAKPWTAPRTPDGQPDLQGFWTNNSYTPLERPRNVNKEFYTREEALAAEKKAAAEESEQTVPGTVADVHYDFSQFGLDRSQSKHALSLRTSLIVDPADGRLPPLTD